MNLKPKTYNLKTNSGQSLIEIIIGLGIGSVLIGASTVAIMGILRSGTANQSSQAASSFNRETLDRVRSFANSNWSGIANLTKGTSTSYFLNATGSTFLIVQGKEGMLDNDVISGLIGHWKFDEATSTANTTTTDASGNGNMGTLGSQVAWATSTCKISNCLRFAGVYSATTDAVNIGSSTSYDTSAFSFAMWIQPLSIHSGNQNANIIMGRETSLTSGFRTGINNNGQIVFWTDQSGGALSALTSSSSIATDRFYHLAVTYDGSVGNIYIDGQSSNSKSGSYVVPTNVKLYINGGIGDTTSSNAYIDDVRWYNRALSANEVKQLYEARVYQRSFSVQNVCRTNDASSTINSVAPCTGGDVNDPLTQKITALTEWTPPGGSVSQLSIADYITRSRNAVFHQSDWSGGTGQDGPLTAPNNRFASGTSIGTSTPGSFRIQGL